MRQGFTKNVFNMPSLEQQVVKKAHETATPEPIEVCETPVADPDKEEKRKNALQFIAEKQKMPHGVLAVDGWIEEKTEIVLPKKKVKVSSKNKIGSTPKKKST